MSEKKNKAPAFQMYASDFLTDTQEFTVCEVGAYIRLLLNQWINGDLPSDPKRLAFIAGMDSQEFMRSWEMIKTKFKTNEQGRLFNSRMENVRDQQKAFSKARKESGMAGAEKRWGIRDIQETDTDSIQKARGKNEKSEKVIYPWSEAEFVLAWEKWLLHKKESFRKKYKTVLSENLSLERLAKMVDYNMAFAIECIDFSIENGWQGVYSNKDLDAKYGKSNNKAAGKAATSYDPSAISALNRTS